MKQKNMILMVVAVGCGLVAALLTSQMSAKGQIEQVDVLVAARDLPVGTMITRDDLINEKNPVVKIRKMPKDGLPPVLVTNKEDLIDKRLARPVRVDETFNPQDLSKGGAITLPEGYDMISLQVGVGNAAAGFVGPGSRVDVLASVRMGNKLYAFPLLVNMLVVAVDTATTYEKNGVFPTMSMVSFAVTQKQALLLTLAKNRGCTLELMLRHPAKSADADRDYDINKVVKLLQDEKEKGGGVLPTDPKDGGDTDTKPAPPKPVTPPAPPEKIPTVKVLLANRDIAPNTPVTADLVKEAFEEKELPVAFAGNAMSDLETAYGGKVFRTGVAKGQWVTPGMIGQPESKIAPQDPFNTLKPPIEPPPMEMQPKPPMPAVEPPVKRKTLDVAGHTSSGTTIYRFEEIAPGQWRKIAELTPEQAAKDSAPSTSKAGPESKRD